jgi:superfamily II DNA or RNA helicase
LFILPDYLWPPQRRGLEQTIDRLNNGVDVCLYGPTGSGKTEQAIQLMHWAMSRGMKGAFYVNRKLLIGQTANRFGLAGLPFGVRAADYEDLYDHTAPVQICSADTERSRVHRKKIWQPFKADLVVIDEVHLQRAETMQEILRIHRENGAKVVGMTATPIGVSHMVDELVISGTLAEYRECKALVPAVVRSIEQPDLSKVKRNATGEYILDGKTKTIYTQTIVGNVIDRWKRYNPDARPTMLYAPGVKESVWLTAQFEGIGVPWAHIDATDVVMDRKRYKATRSIWNEMFQRLREGSIKGVSSRFRLREGVDEPSVYHCILATPIGSLASYLQAVGRVLRYSPETPDSVLVTDHGGSYLKLGSPNHDRPWHDWWTLSEGVISQYHVNQIKERREPEPIRCPECEGERTRGITCPHCGHTHEKSRREVIMADGRMVTRDGAMIRPRYRSERADTAAIWKGLILGHRRKRENGRGSDRSFAQMEAFFAHEHGYFPPQNIAYMPKRNEDFYRPIAKVALRDLY